MIDSPNPFKLAAIGNVDELKRFIDQKTSTKNINGTNQFHINDKDIYNSTLLIWSVRNGCNDVFNYLIQKNVDIEIPGYGGMRVLHHAVNTSRLDIIDKLISMRVSVHSKDEAGNTALHYAASKGILNPIHSLLMNGAHINEVNIQNITPLYKAVNAGHYSCVQRLLAENANPSIADKDGNTPLHIASKMGFENIIKILLQNNACNINQKNNSGKMAIDMALSPHISQILSNHSNL